MAAYRDIKSQDSINADPVIIDDRIKLIERSVCVGRELREPDGSGQIDAAWREIEGEPYLHLGPGTRVYMDTEANEPYVIIRGIIIPSHWLSEGLQARIRALFAAHAAA